MEKKTKYIFKRELDINVKEALEKARKLEQNGECFQWAEQTPHRGAFKAMNHWATPICSAENAITKLGNICGRRNKFWTMTFH